MLRRSAVFVGLMVVLAVLLAPALRSYVAQQQQIAALQQHVADQRATVAGLEQQRAAWDDPAYIKAQARSRLKFVMPGERAYNVIDAPAPTPTASPSAKAAKEAGAATKVGDGAWFGDLWRSVEIAGAGQEAAGTRSSS